MTGVFTMVRRDPLGFFLETARRYGDIAAMRFGPRRFWLLSHPDHVKHVLQDHHHNYIKRPIAARVRPLFGESLTTSDGDRWRQERRLIHPAFQMKQFLRCVTKATTEILHRWQGGGSSETIDLLSEMQSLTRTIILRVLFGDLVAPETQANVGRALDLVLERVNRGLWSPFGWLDVHAFAGRRYRHALRTVDLFVSDMVDRTRRDARRPETLVSALLDARADDGGTRMSDAQLTDELKALVVAGSTTTAAVLTWTGYVLSEHSGVRQRLQRELWAVLDGRAPGVDDLSRLPYTRQLIAEVLRLYPPTWVTARMALDDDTIGGYRILAGEIILVSPFVTQRHPAFWDDPDRFDPERFATTQPAARPPFAYFPFGGGPRFCIGNAFALAEIQLVVAMMMQRYRLTLAPSAAISMDAGLTLCPRPGVPMTVHPVASLGRI